MHGGEDGDPVKGPATDCGECIPSNSTRVPMTGVRGYDSNYRAWKWGGFPPDSGIGLLPGRAAWDCPHTKSLQLVMDGQVRS